MDLERNLMGIGSNPALVVVDMINGFTDATSPLGCDCPEVIEANRVLLEAFHKRHLPVYFTTVVYHTDSEARVFRDRLPSLNILQAGTHWVEVDSRLDRAQADQLIEKCWASAFHKTDLDKMLREKGVDSVIVTGLTTSGCVRATAVDALQYDYRVIIPREAVGDRNAQAHAANLFDLDAKYADVIALRDLLEALPD